MTIIAFLVVIFICVGLHEFGHFIVGKLFNFRILAFSIGFGSKLWRKKIGETEYRISLIPLGGYVQFDREFSGGTEVGDERSFSNRPRWQRFLVLLAGPAMNFILAIAALFVVNLIGREEPVYLNEKPVIGYVSLDSLAYQAGIEAGDEILTVNDTPTVSWRDVYVERVLNESRPYVIRVMHLGEEVIRTITPKSESDEFGVFPLEPVLVGGVMDQSSASRAGIMTGDQIMMVNDVPVESLAEFSAVMRANTNPNIICTILRESPKFYKKVLRLPLELAKDSTGKRLIMGIELKEETRTVQLSVSTSAGAAVGDVVRDTKAMCRAIGRLFTGRMSMKNLSGPVGIAKMSGSAWDQGLAAFLMFLSMISLNLGIMNLLPIPILDGGGIVITVLIEGIILRRNLRLKEVAIISVAGWILIAVLMFFAFKADFSR